LKAAKGGMTDNSLRSIAIVGGGVAGWMAAAALNRILRGKATISVFEDAAADSALPPQIGTMPALRSFHDILGIDEADVLRKTGGTFRLGTQFEDWGAKGETYFHPLGEIGANMNGIGFRQHWLRLRDAGPVEAYADFSVGGMAAKADKFTKPSGDKRSVLSTLDYGYHLDLERYGTYLRDLAVSRGVMRNERRVTSARQDSESGFITTLVLEDGGEAQADLFIDCTGILIDDTLKNRYEDWSNWLPCDRMVFAGSAGTAQLPPYMRAVARAAGWQWHIPLRERGGNGMVYSSAHMGDDAATEALLQSLPGEGLDAPRHQKLRSGRRKILRDRNVVALGPAAGMLEPLESACMHMIQIGINRLVEIFPDRTHSITEAVEYNRVVASEFERLRDFLILHYKATRRDDSAFWNHCRAMAIPEPLERKIAQFRSRGRIVLYDEETFAEPGWTAVMIGQGMIPRRIDPIVSNFPIEQLQQQARRIHSVIRQGADSMPPHRMFLEKFCGTKTP
jgi:tryptophan halogenase